MKFKRLISLLLVFILALSVPFVVNAESVTTVIACSDFQHPSGNDSGKATVKELMTSLKSYGITSADGFLCCGDYNYGTGNTQAGIDALKSAVSDVVTENMVFVQGNHDESVSANVGLSQSGNNDTDKYGVFVINEDDYMWYNSNEATIKKTAQHLINYLNEKLESGYSKPIFVLSHLPLHYTMRTRNDGDGMHANYIFDALNAAGKKGLNIIFMYGHDHSNGWDDYLGGAAVYLKRGDSILIAQSSQTVFEAKTLEFTYMNAGFVGYYSNHNGGDTTLTMTSFKISSTQVEIARYNTLSYHRLKSAGVRNAYKNESGYSPDTTVYTSPQTVALTAVTDNSPIEDLIEIPDPNKAEGERYQKITDASDLKDGGKYLLVYNSSSDYIMMPTVVTKSNGSTNRRGFDIKQCDDFGQELWVESGLLQYVWTLKKAEGGWYVGNGTQNARFTSTTDMSVTATLEDTGDLFTISGSDGAFTFSGGSYVLNYNSRGLINGFASNPAPFYIYEYTGYTVFAENGDCDVKSAHAGDIVTVTAKGAPEGKEFDRWEYVTGDGFITDVYSQTVTFTMPNSPVKIKATYKFKPHEHNLKDVAQQSPTCTAAGVSAYKYCTLCDYTEGKQTLDPTDHSYTDYIYNKDATCEKDGTETAACDNGCGSTYTRTKQNTKLIDSSVVFTDVPSGKWYKKYVDYAYTHGLFSGVEKTKFEPNTPLSRAMFVAVLARLDGAKIDNSVKTDFNDVTAGKWYTGSIKWAADNGIVYGVSKTEFAHSANITREQLCAMIDRYIEYKAFETKENATVTFADDSDISKWAKKSVYRCQSLGIVSGSVEGGKNVFKPKDNATRAEAARIITSFHMLFM